MGFDNLFKRDGSKKSIPRLRRQNVQFHLKELICVFYKQLYDNRFILAKIFRLAAVSSHLSLFIFNYLTGRELSPRNNERAFKALTEAIEISDLVNFCSILKIMIVYLYYLNTDLAKALLKAKLFKAFSQFINFPKNTQILLNNLNASFNFIINRLPQNNRLLTEVISNSQQLKYNFSSKTNAIFFGFKDFVVDLSNRNTIFSIEVLAEALNKFWNETVAGPRSLHLTMERPGSGSCSNSLGPNKA